MKVLDFPILFPGTVKPFTNRSIVLQDELIRLRETRNSILFLLNKKIFKSFVICDGSNISIFNSEELNKIKSTGVDVEQISFQQNIIDVNKYGKSNGEFQNINYAVANSLLINEKKGFYKLSPRYYFDNIENIIGEFNNENIFYNYNLWPITKKSPYTMTIFYKTSIEFYNQVLSQGINNCSHEKNGFIEAIFYKKLLRCKNKPLKINYPYFSGIAGTTGKSISNKHFLLRNCVSKLGFLAKVYN